ncbi:MAG: ABC transporter ATP-binding protein [Bacteroidota bacterium]|nr:ABC transporter ATP-binding protein [Bacteroidota bacterium]
MKILLRYLKPYWKLVALSLLLALINQCFSLFDPMITGRIMDECISEIKGKFAWHQSEFIKAVLTLLGMSIGVAMISRIAKNFQDYVVNVITQKSGAKIYAEGLKHSLELPYQSFEDQRSGETLGILQKVRTDSEKLIQAFVGIVFTSLVAMIFVLIYSISVSGYVGLIYVACIPIIGLASYYLSKKVKEIQRKIVGETTSLAGSTTESLRNIELVKSLGLEQQEINRLNNTTIKILGLELKKVKYIRSLNFIQGTIVNTTRSAMVFVLLLLIFKGSISVGQYLTFLFYSFAIFNPLQEFGNIILVYREAQISLFNFKKLMEMPVESQPQSPVALSNLNSIKFKDVSFQHQTATTKALDKINFEVKTGETIAFVGPSGSGKTTLIKLLVGLYRTNAGQVLYNEKDAHAISISELRSQIGFVTQDTQLFSGTIKENLLFVNPSASDEQIMDVLKKASCDGLLARADKGIDSLIGEGGVKVSGGEKQRLSIARALLRNPNLLVFDEATSALDSLTEEEINETIKTLISKKEHITILIAHRLSTVMHADRIYVLEHGSIIEQGKHQDLVNEKGLYYAMWRQQIGERKS